MYTQHLGRDDREDIYGVETDIYGQGLPVEWATPLPLVIPDFLDFTSRRKSNRKGASSGHSTFIGTVVAAGPEDVLLGQQNVLGPLSKPSGTKRPITIFVLTDDQELHKDSLDYVPYLKEHDIDKGTLFKRQFCTTAICCPSRVSLWTGQLAHNTNVTDVNPPYGMWDLTGKHVESLVRR